MTCFVAYGPSPNIPGEYKKSPFTGDARAFFHERGGFWSLVHGEHRTLICTEILKNSVTNMDRPFGHSRNPGAPIVEDEVLVVIPTEPFTEWTDASVADSDLIVQIPIPACRVEVWKRLT